ncbi:hypothetical protein L7F22_030014 [Adiantum nelumboides]|nr:hypothetical protein [Adiantum nelumboides]
MEEEPNELRENLAGEAHYLGDLTPHSLSSFAAADGDNDDDREETLPSSTSDLQPSLTQPLLSPLNNGQQQQKLSRGTSQQQKLYRGTSQVAIIGAKYAPVESLDYEIVENDVFKQDWRTRSRAQILQYILLKWTLAFLVGICTGITAFAINFAIENISGYKLLKVNEYFQEDRITLAFSILTVTNLLLALSSSILVAYVAPAAAGSGIPEVKAYLNGIDAPDILAPKTLFVKVVGSIGSVAGGLDTGKEGPLVHSASCIAALIGQGGSKRYHISWSWLRYFKNDRDRRDLITCGAAAGVTAAFRAPVGGVLFALEEVTSWWRSSLLWRAFFTTALVSVVLQTGITYCSDGSCGLFGSGGLIIYNIEDVSVNFGLAELLPVVTLGVVGGVLGCLFTFINGRILRFYFALHNNNGPMVKILHVAIVSLISTALMIGLPWLGDCIDCPTDIDETCPTTERSGNFKRFRCPDGQYNDLASLIFNVNDDVVRNLFSVGTANEFKYKSLLIYMAQSYFLALITYGTPVPSGLFLPVMITGATYGRMAGMLMRTLNSGLSELDEGLYAVLGAASFLGGAMRMTVSICVILLELTNNLFLLPLTMLVLLISKSIGDLFNYSVFDQIVHLKGLPYLEEHTEPYMKHLTALDVCGSPLVTLSAVESVENIVDVLQRTNHHAFPVIDNDAETKAPILYGLILRSHLLVLLKGKQFFSSKMIEDNFESVKTFKPIDFAKPGSGKRATINDVKLNADELKMFVDLHPFTNTSPYTVVDTMSLAKAYALFRGLALRHLCVVPKIEKGFPIVGILTRHDFMDEHIFSRFPHLRHSKWKSIRVQFGIMQKALDLRKLWRQSSS